MDRRDGKYRSWNDFQVEYFQKHPKEIKGYLDVALKDYEGDGEIIYLLMGLKNIVKAKGVCYVSRKAGLSRQAVWHALSSKGNPTITTLNAILGVLGYKLSFKIIKHKAA